MSIWNRPGAWLICAGVALNSCGYHVAGQANLVPKTVHTIAVPPFANATVRYKLTDLMPEALSRELIARTHYQVINDLCKEQQRLIDESDRIQRTIDQLEKEYQDMTTPQPEPGQ